jgi:two-component system nitrogen regulation response regulator NtrX
MHRILVVDDEIDIRELLKDILQDEGYEVTLVGSAAKAVELATSSAFDAILLDIWLEGSAMDGLGVLKAIKAHDPDLPVIMISGHGTVETAVKAIKTGAYDFIEKPFKVEKLLILMQRAISTYKILHENAVLRRHMFKGFELEGHSKAMQVLAKQVQLAATSNSRVIVVGEEGTGKEFIARSIHMNSARRHNNFGIINAAQLSEESFLQQLHGDEKKPAMLQICQGGTLYIDEIMNLNPGVQSLLLNLLQDTKLDIRFIAASRYNLNRAIEEKHLNSSLYYRLNVLQIIVPPLRQRKEDVESLANKFIEHFCDTLSAPKISLSQDALLFMQSYEWPGNVRQLKNVVEWLVIMKSRDTKIINAADLPAELHNASKINEDVQKDWFNRALSLSLREARDEFEKYYLSTQLLLYGGNISKTAEHVGIDRTALHRKLKSLRVSKD